MEENLEKEAIKIIVCNTLNITNAKLISIYLDEIPTNEIDLLTNLIDKYIVEKIPVQYITNKTFFYNSELNVNQNVLIPRRETEELISNFIKYYQETFNTDKLVLADIGTGSGAIAIAIKKELPNLQVIGVDISKEALEVAKSNALKNNVDITFYEGNMLEPLIKNNIKVDIIISNPPYIPSNDEVDMLVLNNEPHLALFGGDDGMKYLDEIVSNAHKVLNEKSILAFEHDYRHKEKMITLGKKYFKDSRIYSRKDLSNKDRMTFIINK